MGPTAALASHMDVDKEKSYSRSNLKPVTLELGGKSPFIGCKDADVDKAVELAHFALFFNQGQCCCAGSRTYVHESVYDEFIEKAKIDTEQFEKIFGYIRSGVESGADSRNRRIQIGNQRLLHSTNPLLKREDDILIAKAEIFGLVQSILKFRELDDVVKRKRANNFRCGLAAGVFTQNIDKANTFTRALRIGTVWVNCFDTFDAAIPRIQDEQPGKGKWHLQP